MHITSILSSLLLSSTVFGAATIRQTVGHDQLLLVGKDGRSQVVDRAEFMKTYVDINDNPPQPEMPSGIDPSIFKEPVFKEVNETDHGDHDLPQRGCQTYNVIYQNPTQEFSDWDIAMTQVTRTGPMGGSLAVNQGITVADDVASAWQGQLILAFLAGSYGETYSHTFTSAYNVITTFPLPANSVSLIVSNPWVVRRSGHIATGCIGEPTAYDYQANKHHNGTFGGLSWVQGLVGSCSHHTYPVPFCIGKGVHH